MLSSAARRWWNSVLTKIPHEAPSQLKATGDGCGFVLMQFDCVQLLDGMMLPPPNWQLQVMAVQVMAVTLY